ncbi:MAG TPA: hypothetical protein VMC84_12050 [Methanocella sp.]|uniref:hypothetical protein n=1 Tax=Methanocella sp. TaxID=2052833 RepID=UPI002C399DE2|nr:hypothetical protein [Methanocella sp.]HTY91899.1 hypothetical protein [Methanocella sp.]
MKIVDSATRAYRLDGNVISEESLDIVLNAAYAMLAKNDELAPPYEEWDEEEAFLDGRRLISYFAATDAGNEIRVTFNFKDMTAHIQLSSPEEECYIGDDLLCTITSAKIAYTLEEWL